MHAIHRNQLAGGKATIAFVDPAMHLFINEVNDILKFVSFPIPTCLIY